MTLQEMKQKVDIAKTEKAKFEGQIESINKRLKDEFSLNSIEDAEAKVISLEKEITEAGNELREGTEKLEKDYNWE